MTGIKTHTEVPKIIRNIYVYCRNINHAKFCDHLDKANQFFKLKYGEEGDKTRPVPNNKYITKRFTRPSKTPGKQYHPDEETRKRVRGFQGMR